MRVMLVALGLVLCSSCEPTEEAGGSCDEVGCELQKPDDDNVSNVTVGNLGVCLRMADGSGPWCYQGCSTAVSCGPAEVCVPLNREPNNAPRAAGVCVANVRADGCAGAYSYDDDDTPAYECRAY